MTVLLALVVCLVPLLVMLAHGRRTHTRYYRGPIQRHPKPYTWEDQ